MNIAKSLMFLCGFGILSGCASHDEVVGELDELCIGSPPVPAGKGLPLSSEAAREEIPVLVIGNNFGQLKLVDSGNAANAFAVYSGCSDGQGHLRTVEDFTHAVLGWTWIEVRNMNLGIVSTRRGVTALVPTGIFESEDFAEISPGPWGGRGNLVAAQYSKGQVFVVVELLCRRGDDYAECASQYKKGVYNAATGFEVDFSFEPKSNAAQIDTTNFKLLD